MEYVDGGGSIPTWVISAPINFAIGLNPAVSLAFGGVTSLIKYGISAAAKNATKKFLRVALNALAFSVSYLYTGLSIALKSVTDSRLDLAVTAIFNSFSGMVE